MAQYAAHHTERLGFLIAHRPGFVAPTLAARKIATFDHLTEGRIALHIISGASDAEQEGDGDFAPKDVRYRRAAEYIEVMKLAWSARGASTSAASSTRCAAPSRTSSRCSSRIR